MNVTSRWHSWFEVYIKECEIGLFSSSSVDITSDFNDHDIKIKQQLKPKERSDLGFFLDFVIWKFGQKKKKGGEKITQTKSEEPKHRPVESTMYETCGMCPHQSQTCLLFFLPPNQNNASLSSPLFSSFNLYFSHNNK